MAGLERPVTLTEVASAILYFANYFSLWFGYADAGLTLPHPFGILWSLAVEEHFYLLFPLIFVLTLRVRCFLPAMIIMMVLSLAWRFYVYGACGDGDSFPLCGQEPEFRIYKATDTRLDAILYGCALAWVADRRPYRILTKALRHPASVVVAGAVLLGSLAWRDPVFRDTGRYTVQSLAIALGLGGLMFSPALHWLRAALSGKPLLLIGRMSYVLYLFHWMAVALACRWTGTPLSDGLHSPAWYAIAITATVAPSTLVYWGVERPLARWRKSLRPQVAHAAAADGRSRSEVATAAS
jgi:peptidoglycan/LPS O-acetylase OafA/YrhL